MADDINDSDMFIGALNVSKPLLRLKKFKVCLCPVCFSIQVTSNEERLVCLNEKCKKSSVYRVRGAWNVKLFESDVSSNANKFCSFWKRDYMVYGDSPVSEVKKRFIKYLKTEI